MSSALGHGLFIATVSLYAVTLSLLLITAIKRGNPRLTIALALLAGPPPGLIVWFGLQKGQPNPSTLTFQNISYSATIGDLFILIPILALSAVGWRRCHTQLQYFWRRPGWVIISVGAGYAIGLGFHFVLGGTSNGEVEALLHNSATSWTHNLGVVPVFASTMLMAVVPLFTVEGGRRLALGATALFVVGWGGLVAVDTLRMQLDPANPWHFDPHWLDAVMDWSRWTVRT